MSPKQPNEKPLQSWKEIASYLERDIRTAIRWEKREGLPVRRHTAGRRSSVYAYRSELDAWRAGHRPRATAPPEKYRSWVPLIPAVAGTVALAAVALLMLNGPILNPPAPLAEAAEEGIQTRQIWTGPHAEIGVVSSDGHYLTLTDRDGNLAIRDLQTGDDRALTDTSWEGAPSEYSGSSIISPDGSQIAFAWINERRSPRIQIRVGSLSDPSGTFTARTVYENEDVVYAYPAGWFPDGKEILAVLTRRDRTYQIARLSVEANAVEILTRISHRLPETGRAGRAGGDFMVLGRHRVSAGPRSSGSSDRLPLP